MRKLASAAIPFSLGIFAAVYLLPRRFWLVAGGICGLLALLGLLLRGEKRLRVVLALLGLAAAALWIRGYDALLLAPAEALDGRDVAVTATVSDWPEPTQFRTGLLVRVDMAHGPGVQTWLSAGGDYAALRPGDRLAFTAHFRFADDMAGEETEYWLSQGIHLTAFTWDALAVTPRERIPARYWPAVVSKAIRESIAAHFPPDTVGFMTALTTGDKSALSQADAIFLQRAGISHVVAVSGMHVAFLAGMLAVLFRRRQRLGAGVILCLLLFFAAVTGNAPSVLRAVVMEGALLVAPLCGRESDKVTTLSVALLLILLANPHAAASVSLQLSFAAVAGIYLLASPIHSALAGKLPKKPVGWQRPAVAVGRFAAATLATTFGALAFTTPLSAVYFGSVSIVAPLTNLLTLWAVSDGFMLGLLAGVVGIFSGGLGWVLGVIPALLTRFILAVTRFLGALPFAAMAMHTNIYPWLWLGFVYITALAYALWKAEKKRPLVIVCLWLVTLVPMLFFGANSYSSGDLTVSVLDVGQGQSVALWSAEHTVLVDCGGNGPKNAGDVAADYVQSTGTSALDLLVLTHYHTDHANGVPELLARLEVAALALPDVEPDDPLRQEIEALAAAEGAEVWYITENTTVTFGRATLALYAPLGAGGANEEGLSMVATSGTFDVLLTGDMTMEVERRLLKYCALPDVEVFVAGHHGSQYASSQALLQAIRPEYAVISVGRNSYGHPTVEAMERLAAAGAALYRTDQMGTVTLRAR